MASIPRQTGVRYTANSVVKKWVTKSGKWVAKKNTVYGVNVVVYSVYYARMVIYIIHLYYNYLLLLLKANIYVVLRNEWQKVVNE